MTGRKKEKKIDTVEKLAALLVESVEDLRTDMNGGFDRLSDRRSTSRITSFD